MSPKIAQILDRREEIRVHQAILKELEASLTPEEQAELAGGPEAPPPTPTDQTGKKPPPAGGE